MGEGERSIDEGEDEGAEGAGTGSATAGTDGEGVAATGAGTATGTPTAVRMWLPFLAFACICLSHPPFVHRCIAQLWHHTPDGNSSHTSHSGGVRGDVMVGLCVVSSLAAAAVCTSNA